MSDQTYEIDLKINKDAFLKDLREIKAEVKSVSKDINMEVKKLRLKWNDVLVIRIDGLIKLSEREGIQKRLSKQLHRKVIVLDRFVKDIEVIER